MSQTLRGRIALVTGAGSGIGEATARLLHARGAEVVVADIDRTRGTAVADDLGDRARFAPLDVTDEHAWKTVVDDLRAAHGRIDLLVHSAGAASKATIAETSVEEFRRMIDVNLLSTFLALRSVPQAMPDGSSIVTLSSVRGVLATEGLGAYGAAKFGVRALTRVAALELAARDIRVNAVCPGSITTPITDGPGFGGDDVDAYVRSIPLQRRGTPDEVAALIGFLLSDESGYLTGTDLIIDGGTAAGRTVPRTTS